MQLKQFWVLLAFLPFFTTRSYAGEGVALNTWLIAGLFENDAANNGFQTDLIGESTVAPQVGDPAGTTTWRYFDDRLFSRNYDCYNDLFSYYRIKQGISVASKFAYVHCYVYVPSSRSAVFELGADNEYKLWINGELFGESIDPSHQRDGMRHEIVLHSGWNRILLKIANQSDGRLGFYARLSSADGQLMSDATLSTGGGQGDLVVATQAMDEIQSPAMPNSYREWPYVAIDVRPYLAPGSETSWKYLVNGHWTSQQVTQSPRFQLLASGGKPPYLWSLIEGVLPEGVKLETDGSIVGTINSDALLGKHELTFQVTDQTGATADRTLALTVKERPNRWLEDVGLIGLIHAPEVLVDTKIPELAGLMRRQGYKAGIPIGYGNGWVDSTPRWLSVFSPDNPKADCLARYKSALEQEGLAFGIYLGELALPQNGGENGAVLIVEEAVRQCRPKMVWFDQAGRVFESTDAFFSAVRAADDEIVVIKNGISTIGNGDWDMLCFEGIGAWGDRLYDVWPRHLKWPKAVPFESWRVLTDPSWSFSVGVDSDWREYQQVVISLIAEGFVANLDHSPTFHIGTAPGGDYRLLDTSKSTLWNHHVAMADWANPMGLPSRLESYIGTHPAPLNPVDWGYALLDRSRKNLYLHIFPQRKSGKGLSESDLKTVSISPLHQRIVSAKILNTNLPMEFTIQGDVVRFDLGQAPLDPVSTILKLELETAMPNVSPAVLLRQLQQENAAFGKPARLLTPDGTTELPPSGSCQFAENAVDGSLHTTACASQSWSWMLEVDLEQSTPTERIELAMNPRGFATQYEIRLSPDRQVWHSVASVIGNSSGGLKKHSFSVQNTRYVRVVALLPDREGQPGGQMGVDELRVLRAKASP